MSTIRGLSRIVKLGGVQASDYIGREDESAFVHEFLQVVEDVRAESKTEILQKSLALEQAKTALAEERRGRAEAIERAILEFAAKWGKGLCQLVVPDSGQGAPVVGVAAARGRGRPRNADMRVQVIVRRLKAVAEQCGAKLTVARILEAVVEAEAIARRGVVEEDGKVRRSRMKGFPLPKSAYWSRFPGGWLMVKKSYEDRDSKTVGRLQTFFSKIKPFPSDFD